MDRTYSAAPKEPLRWRVLVSYIIDYLLIILLAILFLALDAIEPFHQPFSLTNISLQYPYATYERVPLATLYVVAVLAPALIIALYALVIDGFYSHHRAPGLASSSPAPFYSSSRWKARWTLRERLWELNCGLLGLALASGSAYVITSALKNATGKPRPDFIARCLPRSGAQDASPFGLSNGTICTQTDKSIMKDGYRSFPSGHSSSSWGGLFYLSLYLAGKMHLLDSRGEVWKVFVVLVPTAGAALVAISRIEDARHHPFDVIFGSLLGAVCAFVAYRQYFPSLTESWKKGRAYPMRSWGMEATHPGERVVERKVARDKGRDGLHSAPLPNMHWAPQSPSSSDGAGAGGHAAGSAFRERFANTERPRQQESDSEAQRFAGPSVQRVQRLRTHSRNDSDLHLGGKYADRSSEEGGNESFEMQNRSQMGIRGNHSSVDLPGEAQDGPYEDPGRTASHPPA